MTRAFSEAIRFLWKMDLNGLDVIDKPHTPTLLPQKGLSFVVEPGFRPLLAPPRPGETKLDQIYRWAELQAALKPQPE